MCIQRRGSFLKDEQMGFGFFLRHDVGETKPNVVFQIKLQFLQDMILKYKTSFKAVHHCTI